MIKKILKKALNILVKINNWVDKDADKQISSVVTGIIILVGILVLHKAYVFVFAAIIIANRVIHRFGYWRRWELSMLMEGVGTEVDNDLTIKGSQDGEEKKD